MTNRPAYRKPYMNRRPIMRPYNPASTRGESTRGRFNGYVDNRVIPDADLPTEEVSGMLELSPDGQGLLRPDFNPTNKDIYISSSQIKRFNLRPGDMVTGPARQPKDNERYWGLLKVEKVNGVIFADGVTRPEFDKLVPIFPNEKLKLETDKLKLATRVIDLVAPVGKGQRGLIVSPPKAGKTTILKNIAEGVAANNPDVVLMAVLVGERPEEVTDIRKHVKGEVAASNFDESAERQTRVAELALERAKRLVEQGKDVVILLDSITRLARAYNLAIPTSGRTLSGGFDPVALYPPKKFFGAARNFENGSSLTIIGTALVDTGSRMDELIYEEFKGTGNMELHLSRKLAERRIYPAIDIQRSGTRQEQLLFSPKDYEKIVTMRRMIDVLDQEEMTEVMMDRLRKTKDNAEFLKNLGK
ncbi:transcription termination factor Rho [Patescibacteria group bacterium]|nr:transcription termination factor Rho [Patescibacteria group bacterium]MBU1499412.1 transcription termination factor Rho [Patescibacteria group bacterium]